MTPLYLEDLQHGAVQEFGTAQVTTAAIKQFAREYDPQPFHLDETAALDSALNGLAASGWHTAALTMGMIIRDAPQPIASLGSPGFDDLRWHRPVRPGDRLRVRLTCLDTRPSDTHPERGRARLRVETLNQESQVVMEFTSIALMARRRGADAGD